MAHIDQPVARSVADIFERNPDFAALARAYGWWASERVDTTAAFEPVLRAALAAGRPALIHLKLAADVITSRTTLAAIRRNAEARLKA